MSEKPLHSRRLRLSIGQKIAPPAVNRGHAIAFFSSLLKSRRHEQSEAIQTRGLPRRLSLDRFAVARDDGRNRVNPKTTCSSPSGRKSRERARETSWAAAARRGRASRSPGRARQRLGELDRAGDAVDDRQAVLCAPGARRGRPCRRSRARSPRRGPRRLARRSPPTDLRAAFEAGIVERQHRNLAGAHLAQRRARPYFIRLVSIGAIERDSVVTTAEAMGDQRGQMEGGLADADHRRGAQRSARLPDRYRRSRR